MIKILLSIFLAFTFTVSYGNCNESNSGDECNQKISNTCNQDYHSNSQNPNDTNSEDDHCIFHCNHTVNASIPFSKLKLPAEATKKIKANYLFAYQDPTLDSIERPPLSL